MSEKKIQIITDLDLSTIVGTTSVQPEGDFSKYDYISIQHVWTGVTGTLDATIDLQQKNAAAATVYDTVTDLQVLVDSASGSETAEHVAFGGAYINVLITENNITGGTLNSYLVAKKKL